MSYWQVLMVNSGSSMLLTTNPTTTQAVCIRYTSALPAPRALQCWTQRHTKAQEGVYIHTGVVHNRFDSELDSDTNFGAAAV